MRLTPALRTCVGLCGSILLLACGATSTEPPARSPSPIAEAPAPLGLEGRPQGAAGDPLPVLEDDEPGDDVGKSAEERGRQGQGAVRTPNKASKHRSPPRETFSPDHPFDDLSEGELEKVVTTDPKALGPLSVGLPNNGRLLNGVQLPDGELFETVAPAAAYGTQETIDYLEAAARKVHERFPGTPPLHVGHVSAPKGGYLSPHLSHQSGRDVDLGFYYSGERRWYARATAANLDVERTWALVRALITETDVEMILLDHGVQRLLKEHALRSGEDPQWVDGLFRTRDGVPALIRHVKGHQTHLHVRFFSPMAQVGAQKVYPLLVKHRLVPPVVYYVHHRAKKGDSLLKLARVYGTTVKAIQRANGLRSTLIMAKRTYKIPRTGGPAPVTGKLSFPTRRLPPYDPADRTRLKTSQRSP